MTVIVDYGDSTLLLLLTFFSLDTSYVSVLASLVDVRILVGTELRQAKAVVKGLE